MTIDVHPSMRDKLGDPCVPLFVTESIKKGDSLTSRALCAATLLGVWSWRGKNEHGGKTVLPDWEISPPATAPPLYPLTNFTARIVADVVEDDGAEEKHTFEVEADLDGRARHFPVPANSFGSMGWVPPRLGAGAFVYPGTSGRWAW